MPLSNEAPDLRLAVANEAAYPCATPARAWLLDVRAEADRHGSHDRRGSAQGAEAPTVPVPAASSVATRHVMQANKSKNTKPELLVRSDLRRRGLTGYRIQYKRAPGRPDVAFPGRRVAIFVHGCFWHRCPYCHPSNPKSNVAFWQAKFARNRQRDERDTRELVERGWTVVIVWECRLKKQRARRTMSEIACEVRCSRPVMRAADRRPGRIVVVGRGQGRYARTLRHIRAHSKLSPLAAKRPGRGLHRTVGKGAHRGRAR